MSFAQDSARPTVGLVLDRLRPWPVTFLAVLTLAMWTGRLGLAWGTAGSTASKLWATVPVVVFVALGVVVLAVVVRVRGPVLPVRDRAVVLAIAGWTIGYWVVRVPIIWFDGRSVGFHLVHTFLALISWTAALAAIRAVRTSHHAFASRPAAHAPTA